MVKGYLIKYKIKINQKFQHSDYLYQKIFRAIYGYKQVVSKSNGKKYIYFRQGVLSYYPFIKKGKNEVIITQTGFAKMLNFLKTGKNPAHKWDEKGNWSATYSMYDVDLDTKDVERAMVRLIKNFYVINPEGHHKKLIDILENLNNIDKSYLKIYAKYIKLIQTNDWYNISLNNKYINKFDILSKQLKNLII